MLLPTKKTPPKQTLSDQTVLIYGPTKIGKSDMCSKADEAIFLATEPGLNSLEVYQIPINSWDDLLNAAAELAEGNHKFKTVVVDTVDNGFKLCEEYICRKLNITHQADAPYGKAWAMVAGEFQRVITKLAFLPYGLYLISHSQEIEIETRIGKYTKVVPTLPDKARKIVLGLVDMILYCDIESTTGPDNKDTARRVMRTKPSIYYEAGDRTGRLPEVIDLNYDKFIEAFNSGRKPAQSQHTQEAAK
jgi:hypothetical protein